VDRERHAQLTTLLILSLVFALVLLQKTGWEWLRPAKPKSEPSPEQAIYTMLDAARAGNVRAYLSAYTGPMAAALRQSIVEATEPGFAKYLKDSGAEVQAVAISKPETLSSEQVKVRVDYVYRDRNEVQIMYLEKEAGKWKIAKVDTAEQADPPVPFGAPAP
jgi:hypothetical protein